MSQKSPSGKILFVDLNNTLIRSDLSIESLLSLLRADPLILLLLPLWLIHGRGYFKQQIAERIAIDPATLPYDQNVLAYIEQHREAGDRIILAAGAGQQFANLVADYLGGFDAVIASSQDLNTKGHNKLAVMKRFAGDQPFDYLAGGHADLSIWRYTHYGLLVSPQLGLRWRMRRACIPFETITQSQDSVNEYLKALRPRRWIKNLLIFLPFFVASDVPDSSVFFNSFIAFISFCFCASGGYLINDLIDLERDRIHKERARHHPVAASKLPLYNVFIMAVSLVVVGFLLAWLVSFPFVLIYLLYIGLVCAYSLAFKHHPIYSVISLTLFYFARVWAGCTAAQVTLSLLPITLLLCAFLCLSMIKRGSIMRYS